MLRMRDTINKGDGESGLQPLAMREDKEVKVCVLLIKFFPGLASFDINRGKNGISILSIISNWQDSLTI